MAGYYLLGFFFFLLAAIINQGTNDNSEITVVEKKNRPQFERRRLH